MKIYNIALIGCGMISKSHIRSIAMLPNAKIVAVADCIATKAKQAGEKCGSPWFSSAEEMLNDVPEIDVCLLVEICARHKKAVLCEKPISMDAAGAERIYAAVQKYGIPYMTAQVVRFWTGYCEIKQMMDAGEFGDIYLSYFSRCSERQVWDNFWLYDPLNGGGAMFDMLVHDVDYMNYLFGPAKQVYTLASKDETGCYDNVFANITYENGVKAVAETAFNMHNGFPFSMYAKIMGTKATAELVYSAGYDINQRDGASAELRIFRDEQLPEIIKLEQYDAYAAETAYFLDCIEKNEKPEVITLEQSVDVMRTMVAIKQSADSGEIVTIKR